MTHWISPTASSSFIFVRYSKSSSFRDSVLARSCFSSRTWLHMLRGVSSSLICRPNYQYTMLVLQTFLCSVTKTFTVPLDTTHLVFYVVLHLCQMSVTIFALGSLVVRLLRGGWENEFFGCFFLGRYTLVCVSSPSHTIQGCLALLSPRVPT